MKTKILLIIALLIALVEGARGQIYVDSYRFGVAGDLPLDQYPGAEMAYSLRKLSTSYSGNCIQIRRASDNTTSNIGFIDNYLDTATLKTFCSSTSCTVAIWYDQSGNGHNLEQTTNTSQPTIFTGGALTKINNKVSVQFDVSNDFLTMIDSVKSDSSWSFFEVKQRASNTTELLTFTSDQANIIIYPFFAVNTTLAYITNKHGYKEYSYSITGQRLYTSFNDNVNASGLDVYDNNSLLSGTATTGARSTKFFRVLGRRSPSPGSFTYSGNNYQEMIFYYGVKSTDRSAINTNINNFYSIY